MNSTPEHAGLIEVAHSAIDWNHLFFAADNPDTREVVQAILIAAEPLIREQASREAQDLHRQLDELHADRQRWRDFAMRCTGEAPSGRPQIASEVVMNWEDHTLTLDGEIFPWTIGPDGPIIWAHDQGTYLVWVPIIADAAIETPAP